MNARKQVALPIDAEFLAKAEAAGVDARSLATRAIRRAVDEKDRERIREEIRQEIAWYNAFVAEHGSFADMMREEFGEGDDAAAAV
jgi:post-segregation antitoxin (ccd killing protein)